MTKALLLLSLVPVGLMAGLFAAFSYAVMPGLRGTNDVAFVASMRAINRAILNPVFGILFGGALLLLIVTLIAANLTRDVRWWVVAALVLYSATILITLACNVPLNNRLDTGAGPVDALRAAFERPWVAWNLTRALTGTGALACLGIALLRH